MFTEKQNTKFFARLRPYDPKGGQPHKKIMIAPLGLTFQAGKFVPLPDKIAGRLSEYLQEQYPEDDYSRPSAYQIVTQGEMKRILDRERGELRLKERAATLGISVDEMRRLERDQRRSIVDGFDFDRVERLKNREPSALEEMASEIGVKQEGGGVLDEIAKETNLAKRSKKIPAKGTEQSKEVAAEIAKQAAQELSEDTEIEGFDDGEEFEATEETQEAGEEDLWAEMQGDLGMDEETETPKKSKSRSRAKLKPRKAQSDESEDSEDSEIEYTKDEVHKLLGG